MVFDRQPLWREDYPEPVAATGDAVVAVKLAGICSTDLEVVKGYMGFSGVMGHEFVGVVV
ncbi:MAG: alcohol dehydrogenase, partial [Planctomycetaceae bacterium]